MQNVRDGVRDDTEVVQGSDPLDPLSFLGLCGDVNRDAFLNVADLTMVRRNVAAAPVPASYTANRCDHVAAGACTPADVSELRVYFADPEGAPLADTCPGVPHDVITPLYSMDAQASMFSSSFPPTSLVNELFLKVEGTGSLHGGSASATADATFQDSFPSMDWTGKQLRFWMLVPDTSHMGPTDGFRVTLSSNANSVGSSNRIWYFGTSEIPQGVWKEYEIDPTVGWDEAHNNFTPAVVRRFRIQWNLDEGAGRVVGEQIYLDDFKLVDPAFP